MSRAFTSTLSHPTAGTEAPWGINRNCAIFSSAGAGADMAWCVDGASFGVGALARAEPVGYDAALRVAVQTTVLTNPSRVKPGTKM